MFTSLSQPITLLGLTASMPWCAQQSQMTKRDHAYTCNLPSSILFANPEEGT